jgi:hypothetical protein
VAAGAYTLTAHAIDNAGGESASASRSIVVTDVGSIVVSPPSPKEGQAATVTVTGASTCGALGIDYGDGTSIVYALSGLPTTQGHTWTSAGTKTITATGHGNCFGQLSTTVTIAANVRPTVSLTSPNAGATVVHPGSVTLSADATDPDGTINRVEFYTGATLIGTDTTAPYSLAWTPPVGTHSLTARAYDDTNGSTTSAARTITVTHVGAISVAPASLVTGQPATVTVAGSPACGAVTIDYGDGTAITYALTGLPTSQSHTWTTAGTKAITATGQGNCVGQSTGSVNVTANTPPTVSMTGPANGSAYTAPAAITLQASASDANGIAYVQFYSGGTLLGTDSTAPYAFAWNGVPYGTYSITARAVDVYGAATTSAAISVSVRDVVGVGVTPGALTMGDTGTVTVTGASTCGAIGIDYGDGTSIVYAISGLPFSQTHVWTSGGWKLITATGHGNCTGQVTLWVYVNWRPSVALTAPVNGNTYMGPANIAIAANASDSDGALQYVAFYVDGALLAVDYVAPYSTTWANVGVGAHSVLAVAVDSSGASASTAVSISVIDPGPAWLTSIAISPSPVAVGQAATVTVSGTNPCGAVQINYGDGNAPFIPITGVPYSAAHVWWTPGTYTITASGQGNCRGQVSTTLVVQ